MEEPSLVTEDFFFPGTSEPGGKSQSSDTLQRGPHIPVGSDIWGLDPHPCLGRLSGFLVPVVLFPDELLSGTRRNLERPLTPQ